jgi:SAM-dependent methyltransferase
MSSASDKDVFLAAARSSLDAGTFVRITLGKFRGQGEPQKMVASPVTLEGEAQLKVVTSLARKDVTKNYAIADGIAHIGARAGEDFLSATLFTTQEDLTLLFSKKKVPHLSRGKPTFSSAPEPEHNRAKQYIVDPTRAYLKPLGVTDASGTVKPSMYAKFKQICHFIEIVDGLIRETDVREAKALSVTDIGSGKGYLTFALYDYLTTKLGINTRVTGIEVRADLVKLCTDIARNSGFSGLTFEAAKAEQVETNAVDIMIALHACDTATDDAIFQGIQANAALIVTAPCCQHELAPQLTRPDAAIEGLMKFGLFKQRQADLITDAARCLLLEASGYKVKVIEFVSTEHTAKNILIAGIRSAGVDRDEARKQYDALKSFAGFKSQHLETLLAKSR